LASTSAREPYIYNQTSAFVHPEFGRFLEKSAFCGFRKGSYTAPVMSDASDRPNSSAWQRLAVFCEQMARRLVPDPLVFAGGLTLMVLAWAMLWPATEALRAEAGSLRLQRLLLIWFDGLWQPGMLAFAAQMCLILLAGFGLASTPIARRGIEWLAGRPTTLPSAVCLVAAVSCVGCWVNWGFGLISAGLLASVLQRRLPQGGGRGSVLVAAAYCGMMIWHGGLSGSAPLKVADGVVPIRQAVVSQSTEDAVVKVPVQATILSSGNLLLTVGLFVGIPLFLRSIAGEQQLRKMSEEHDVFGDGVNSVHSTDNEISTKPTTGGASNVRGLNLNDYFLQSRWASTSLASLILLTVALRFKQFHFDAMGLDQVNAMFIGLGLLLHRNIAGFLRAVGEGGRAIVGIILLFPFYAGIQGLMRDSGMALALSQLFIDGGIALAEQLGVDPVWTFTPTCFLSAALVNVFVPSGGGQWIVQGPLMCGAAEGLGIGLPQTVMAISYGDQLTNMIQPFWAIPLMGITGTKPREFLGSCVLLMLVATPVFIGALLFLC